MPESRADGPLVCVEARESIPDNETLRGEKKKHAYTEQDAPKLPTPEQVQAKRHQAAKRNQQRQKNVAGHDQTGNEQACGRESNQDIFENSRREYTRIRDFAQ